MREQRRAPVVGILTDFGLEDIFVGVMKGVLLARCPDVQLVDVTHAVPAGDLLAGAFLLRAAAPYFPPGTILLAVVDPGVGGTRRPVCMVAEDRCFVGPDNGLLWPAAAAGGEPQVFELSSPQHRLPVVSSTFHGRDIFAPAAATLAAGVPPAELGPLRSDPVRLEIPAPTHGGDAVEGEVLWVDRFGNLITNLAPGELEAFAPADVRFSVGVTVVGSPVRTYSAAARGELCAVLSSFGTYEIAVRDGNAAERLGARRGTRVMVRCAADG